MERTCEREHEGPGPMWRICMQLLHAGTCFFHPGSLNCNRSVPGLLTWQSPQLPLLDIDFATVYQCLYNLPPKPRFYCRFATSFQVLPPGRGGDERFVFRRPSPHGAVPKFLSRSTATHLSAAVHIVGQPDGRDAPASQVLLSVLLQGAFKALVLLLWEELIRWRPH